MASKRSKRPKKRTQPRRRTSRRRRRGINLWLVLIPVALVLLVGGVWLLATPASSPEGPPPLFNEGPRLVFDETSISFGTVPLGMVAKHDFVYRNVGNAPLVLLDKPEIEAVEGC